ncbi:unnamed protein product [Calypogeia fissa]
MPKVTIYKVSSPTGEGKKIVGTFSAKQDDSYADARLNLDRLGYFDFPFDFVDEETCMQMQSAWEKGNHLEDSGHSITIIPKLFGSVEDLRQYCLRQPAIPTDSVLQEPTLHVHATEDSVLSPLRGEEEPNPLPDVGISDPHVSLRSELMDPKLRAHLEEEIRRFKDHLTFMNIKDMEWVVKSFDQKEKVVVLISCGECHSSMSCEKKGQLDKGSLKNCFNNFRNNHMGTAKHLGAMAKNRGESLTSAELKQKVKPAGENNKRVLGEHIAIVDDINSSQTASSIESAPFKILGDTSVESPKLSKYKIFCNVCCEHMVLVPRQRNLQANLDSHLTGKKHLDHLARGKGHPGVNQW